ncbi:hypothetical protein LOK46_13480 [Methylobacterium sp. NMS14P]|uniref:phage tail assembly chaperone n=1 Tax=Methylobacterium sp. NMS14P TaxID=2894310 RepID=UPI002359D393|nr:hypothetical protein [Methylobacterium sp. NMS14P]WCS27786.1 hypothetical protein LOK46_13480 [Methylobacterium sp. NMS14P]
MEAEVEADPTFDPPALRTRPDLWPHLAYISNAFTELSSDRRLGALGGCGPIPWSSIELYARRLDIADLDEFERFARLIRAQDRVYLADMAEKQKKGSGGKSK